jgi:RHS repeat-associated protein
MISRIAITLVLISLSIQTVDAASFGRTSGKFAVSQIGTAQYSIPIWTPPGPKGIQPNLALSYDSSGDIGPLGIGWSLAGLGAVTRCNLTTAQDTTPAPVALVTTDGYCLNGNRLRLTSGTYGTAGSTYQTEIADFSNITANGTAGNGPSYFTVQTPNGLTYQYGFTDTNGNGAGSQVLAAPTSTASTWFLSKVSDRSGNNFVVNYTTLTGTAVPSDILWTPTSAGASSYVYKMLFNYGANVPPSSITKYVAGTAILNSELLTSISISASGTVIKDYFLGYQASPTTGRDELISVQECADSAQSNCLLATNVAYQNGSIGVATTATTALSSTGAGLNARYDLNGDGIPDLIYRSASGPWYVAFGSATGYGTPINTGITGGQALFGNLTGGKQDGVLAAESDGTWWYYTWNGSSFTGASTGTPYDSTSYGFQLADINGDGLPDLIDLNITPSGTKFAGTINTRLNTSSGSTVSFSSTVVGTGIPGPIDAAQLATPDIQYGKLRRYDFDGDGRDDLVVIAETGTAPNFTFKTYTLVSTGAGFTKTLIQSAPGSDYAPVYFTNWNDDACTDFVAGGYVYISACNGAAGGSLALGAIVIGAMDWDGDGRTDLLVANGSTIGVFLSTGTGYGSMLSTTIPYSSTCQYVTMGANGDGLDDLGCWSQTSPYPLTYYQHNGAGQPPDLATSFVDGYGVTYSPSYVPLSASGGIYTKGTSAVFPNQDYSAPQYVVSSYTSSDGIGGSFSQSYTYAGAIGNLQGRGFQGFTTVSRTDSRTGFKDTRTYSTGTLSAGIEIPTAGRLLGESVTQSAGTNVAVGTYTLSWLTLASTTNNERYFPYTASSSVNKYEVQIGGPYNGQLITTTAINYGTPDIYGNFASVEKTVTDEDSGSPYFSQQWTTTTATTISASPSTWCNSLPTERDVTNTAPGVPAITRHLSLTPDYSFCRETQQVVEEGNSTYQVTTGYGFDAFGNINNQTVTGIGMAARATAVNWGTTGQFPTQFTNPLSQISYPSFDPVTGQLLSFKDPNGITTSWQYDPFGRLLKETHPDGTYNFYSYNDCATWSGGGCLYGSHAMAMAHNVFSSAGVNLGNGTDWLDQYDRVVIKNTWNFASQYDRVDIRYDNLGNVAQQSMPCDYSGVLNFCTTWTTLTHDLVNRLVKSQRPISASDSSLQTTAIQYSGRTTTTTDPQAKVTTNITQVTGGVGRTMDNNGYYVNFNRDAFGSVLSVTDELSNTLRTMTYAQGVKAFRTSLVDMDLGTRSYTIDALGETTSYSDGKGQTFSITHDALSRPLVRTEPDLTTTWVWGTSAASFNIGKLQSLSSTSDVDGTYSEAYGYDSAGRSATTSIVIPNLAGTFTYTKTYNATTGLLDTLQYPLSTSSYNLKLQYTYSHLFLQSVSDFNAPTTVFWTADNMNARGDVTKETLGNGVVVTRTYDAVTGWLSNILAGVGSGSGIQNNAYLYDEMGNVTQRQDNNQGLTEDFYYDNLYRLDHSTLGGAVNLQMSYDAMGNITSRSDVAAGATWTYDPVHKHQVTQAGNSSFVFVYDANGNMTSRNATTDHITWTSANYVSNVGGPGEDSVWTYGPNRQVYKSYQAGPGGDETTYHVGKLFELVTFGGNSSNYRHYIMAGNELVAIYSRTFLGVNTLNYIQSDHQGSIASITTSTPATDYVNESFTAFGDRRNGETWSGAPTTADETAINAKSRWGYTGHTAIGVNMGLVHMKGRIEDAVIGRFMSPDPRGTIRGNTQSWNRYSYVNNNPLTYTDPTGFCGEATFTRELKVGEGVCLGGGGGASVPQGSVEGLSGNSGDVFGNLDDVGTPDPPSVSSLNATISAAMGNTMDQLSAAAANIVTTETQSSLPDTSSLAQSQNPNGSQTSQDQSDGAILTPASGGNTSSAAMIVNLAPGSNTLQLTVTNIDPVMTGIPLIDSMQSEIVVSTTLTISNASGSATYSGPLTQSGQSPLTLAPGQTYFQSTPGFTGPGTASITFVNYSPTLLGVTFGVIYQKPQGAGN